MKKSNNQIIFQFDEKYSQVNLFHFRTFISRLANRLFSGSVLNKVIFAMNCIRCSALQTEFDNVEIG